MKSLYMLELQFNVAALYRFLHTQGQPKGEDDAALSYGVHAWLGAAFGEMAPRPWRLLMDKQRPPRILGYARHNAGKLQQRLVDFTEPGIFQVCPEPQVMIASRAMPVWQKGRRLGFQILVCPVGRKSESGIEKDLFLIRADTDNNDGQLNRETVYCDWAKQRFARYSVDVDSIGLAGFRLAKQKRQTQTSKGKRAFHQIVRPQALLEGTVIIKDPEQFDLLLEKGMGRHCAFGYGMLLLRPPL